MKKLAILSLSLFLPIMSQAIASDVSCEIMMAVRCPCPASLYVKCSDGKQGYIPNQTKLSTVTLIVDKREVVINKPKNTVRDFYVPDSIPEVRELFSGARDIDTKNFTIPSKTKLYKDEQMNEEAN